MPLYHFAWTGKGGEGFEVTTKGNALGRQFSAFNAMMPDGRSIEQWYQCDIKGYAPGGRDWRLGKGKPARFAFPGDQLWQMYLSLYRLWSIRNSHLLFELKEAAAAHDNTLSDMFANSNDPNSINQARALAQIINEWII